MYPQSQYQYHSLLLFVISFLGLWVLIPTDELPRKGKDIALFIAIDEYEHWQDLRNPIRDAEEIAGDLSKNYGFDTVILRNPTELEIFGTLNDYVRRYYQQDDQLLIFFSGHGHLIRSSREGFIIPSDARSISDDPYGSSFITHDRLRNIIASIPCEHVLFIMDSCFSGTFDQRIVRGETDRSEGVKRLNAGEFENRTLLYLTAGGDEYVDDGSDHSPFARAFLLALRNFGDQNKDGVITFLELSAYVQNSVEGQKPTAGDFKEHKGGDFYFFHLSWEPVPEESPRTPMRTKGATEYATVPFTNIGDLTLSPRWSPDGEWITYSSNLRGNMDIWKKRSDGGKAIRLTKISGNETQPAWSPDGQFIAFASDQMNGGGLMVMSAEGEDPRQLAPFGDTPSWSSDGKKLTFQSHGNIYMIQSEGGNPELLVEGTSANPHPVWAANDKFIIYWNRTLGDIYKIYLENGNFDPLSLIPAGQEVGSLSLDQQSGRLLYSRGSFGGNKDLYEVFLDPETCDPLEEPLLVSPTPTDDDEASFSPDNKSIAFIAKSVERHLYSIPLDPETGLSSRKPEAVTRIGKMNYYPNFSPDGKSLIWTSHQSGQGNLYIQDMTGDEEAEMLKVTAEWGSETREISGCIAPNSDRIFYASTIGGSYQLWEISEIEGEATPLTKTENPLRDVHPSLSPDGKSLAFYSNRSDNWDIWLLSVDGEKTATPLTNWAGNELYPCWAPDGKRIAFQSDRNGNADIWTYSLEDGTTAPLVNHPAEESWCSWSPNGRWFYFVSNRSGQNNIWRMPAEGGPAEAVTDFQDLDFGLPDNSIYTKFAVTDNQLVLSLEERKGDVFLLQERD